MRASLDPVAVEQAPADLEAAPFRLRHVLLFAALGLLIWSGLPRLRAAWTLHSAATTFADYALCMVGPTGPSLLRDNPTEFRRLVRRRLVAAVADDRPFSKCAKGAGQVMQSLSVERAHAASADSFVEYGGAGADGRKEAVRLDELAVTTQKLAELADEAWPFVRTGYTSLVLPSAYAAEAPHPVELPRPGVGRGATPVRSLTRCDTPSGGGQFLLGLSSDHKSKILRTVTPDGITSDAALGPVDARVFAVSCDDHAAVVAIGKQGTRDASLLLCQYASECTSMPLPRFGAAGPFAAYPLDVARVDGATVVAVPMHHLVRVASSRDDGRTWTPFTVAFDPEAHPDVRFDVPSPDHLFVSGKRVLLYGVPSRATMTFPLLASEDAGASFRAP
jgi:hypothetical protein